MLFSNGENKKGNGLAKSVIMPYSLHHYATQIDYMKTTIASLVHLECGPWSLDTQVTTLYSEFRLYTLQVHFCLHMALIDFLPMFMDHSKALFFFFHQHLC